VFHGNLTVNTARHHHTYANVFNYVLLQWFTKIWI